MPPQQREAPSSDFGGTKKRLLVALVAAFVVVGGWLAWQLSAGGDAGPMYQDQSLREWLCEYQSRWSPSVPGQSSGRYQAENAVRKIGTNAIPTLLRMLGQKDSFLSAHLMDFWMARVSRMTSLPAWVRFPSWFKDRAVVQHLEAEAGFKILGADAEQAVPALIKLSEQNVSTESQSATSRAINAIGPTAQRMAIPAFLRAAASSNAPEREVAVWALATVDPEQPQVVPALIQALSDTNFVIRIVAAKALGRFGTNAQAAVPSLMLMRNDPHPRVRPVAASVLRSIDAAAAAGAAGAGVKGTEPRAEQQ